MAFLGSVKRECDIRNRRNRNVREYNSSLKLNEYWFSAADKNFIITGGTDDERNHVLAAAVYANRRRAHGPLIILNGNADFEKKMILLAESGQMGRTVVSSPVYKNYDLFYGMSDIVIRTLFENAAQKKGVADISAFGDYTESFLKILKCKYTPCFHSMFAFARQNDQAIAQFGEAYHVNRTYLEYIKNGAAGSSFRRVLTDYGRAFLNVHGAKSTGFSLSQIDGSDKIYLIWANSELQELFHGVLAEELMYLRSRGIYYTLVANNVNFVQDDPLKPVISAVKQNGIMGICCADVMCCTCDENMQELIIKNTPSLLVLNHGTEDHEDQKAILDRYGKYIHYEPSKGITGTPGLFRLPGGGAPHMGMDHFEKERVTVDDMQGYAIAVRGDSGDRVCLYRKIGE